MSNKNRKDSGIFEIKNKLQKAIADAFSLFSINVDDEDDDNKLLPVADIGKVIRHLGCVPSEDELNEFILDVVKDDQNRVALSDFVLLLEKQIIALRYKPATGEELLKAFQTLDVEGKGSLSVDYMKQLLREGESFDEDEITEVIKAGYDPDHECILYDGWVHKLLGKTRADPYALISVDDNLARRKATKHEQI